MSNKLLKVRILVLYFILVMLLILRILPLVWTALALQKTNRYSGKRGWGYNYNGYGQVERGDWSAGGEIREIGS